MQTLINKHNQIIFFKSGHKKTIQNVVDIQENEMTKLITEKGVEYYINKSEVEMVERYVPSMLPKKKKKQKVHAITYF
jgi:hypothetical protein